MAKFYKIFPIIILFSILFLTHICSADSGKTRAVSLTALQKKLQEYPTLDQCPEELLHLAHLNVISGYIIDSEHNDLIIIGKYEPEVPPLLLEDFVTALRSAWNMYESYNSPFCSIDPDPGVMGELQKIAEHLSQSRTPEEAEKRLQEWYQACRQPQKVRILGIPFHSHFAHTMVRADYDMKTIVDGSDSLGIPGFQSLLDMILGKVRQDIFKSKPVSLPISLNRFWFYPGENLFQQDEGIVLIKECPVTLLTEQMYLAEGDLKGSGKGNTFATEFARDFTAHYREIASERSLYAELENLFRLVALTKIIKYKYVDIKKEIDLDYFLNQFPIGEYEVHTYLKGRSYVKRFTQRQEVTGGYQEIYLWLPSCGGVDINIPITPELFHKTFDRNLSVLRKAILNSKPSSDTIYWDYPLSD